VSKEIIEIKEILEKILAKMETKNGSVSLPQYANIYSSSACQHIWQYNNIGIFYRYCTVCGRVEYPYWNGYGYSYLTYFN
jgi:hypothetical protein